MTDQEPHASARLPRLLRPLLLPAASPGAAAAGQHRWRRRRARGGGTARRADPRTCSSWSRGRRVVAEAEQTGDNTNPRFVVTSLPGSRHRGALKPPSRRIGQGRQRTCRRPRGRRSPVPCGTTHALFRAAVREASGMTLPCVSRCSRSSPIALAARRPSSMSPASSIWRERRGVVRPHARVAVRLQLHAHRTARSPRPGSCAAARRGPSPRCR